MSTRRFQYSLTYYVTFPTSILTVVLHGMVCGLNPLVISQLDVALDWALPDQLAFATVSALLHVASAHEEHRKAATGAISIFVTQIVGMLKGGDRMSFFQCLRRAPCSNNT